MRAGPVFRHRTLVGGPHGDAADLLTLRRAQVQAARGQHPDVGVQADLVAGVPAGHRPAARLADVTDVETPAKADVAGRGRQVHQELHHLRLAEVAVPRQPHCLPCRPRFGQLHHPCRTAPGVAADRHRILRRGRSHRAEQPVGKLLGLDRGRKKKGQEKGAGQDHAGISPLGLTKVSRIRPIRNNTTRGAMPIRCDPLMVVTRAIRAGDMKLATLPDRA